MPRLFTSLMLNTVLLLITACDKNEHVEETPTQGAVEGAQPYQKTLALLQASDEVIPPALPMHPVAAAYNREAIIPPQCYTRTEGKYNPCYVCHQNEIPGHENVMNDLDLQEAYSFSELGMTNHWKGLFNNRRERVDEISDEAIQNWVAMDNYSELAPRLKEAGFKGWTPDLQGLEKGPLAFDKEGFALDGSDWVAFSYKPFPSTFWPTNGSTDDVMIRLDPVYRQNSQGEYSRDVYKANLAILEANFKGLDSVTSWPIDESKVGQDLNGDNTLSVVNEVVAQEKYVGAASDHFLDSHLYPQGTEFLHTVRYLGVAEDGEITIPTRMKEVRYMKKWKAYPKGALARYYQEEEFEKEAGHLPGYTNLGDYGLDNGMGWSLQGFIENANGRLRFNTYEENFFCMGCHSSIGATIDKTFSFARKIDGRKGWGYINLKGMPDAPNRGEEKGEILTYFERVGGGDEFRSNPEMLARWFHDDGSVNEAAVQGKDVYTLITPSVDRALILNKAYKAIVEKQSYLFGRDAVIMPFKNVYDKVDNETAPTLEKDFIYDWDIRLQWR
ncbi:MAG: hypothetical protein ACI9Y1_001630 [Lentisphaeria bacterium]|jgi:hypothetical protein